MGTTMKSLTDDQLNALEPGYVEKRNEMIKQITRPALRWRVVEGQYQFLVKCERDGAHIKITYGDTAHNIPRYGTKDDARRDAETICDALNTRDSR